MEVVEGDDVVGLHFDGVVATSDRHVIGIDRETECDTTEGCVCVVLCCSLIVWLVGYTQSESRRERVRSGLVLLR